MKKNILIFSLLACLFSTSNQAKSNPSCDNVECATAVKTKKICAVKKGRNTCYTITRKDFCLNGKLSQPFVITKPGKYCLGERIEFEPLEEGTCAIQILSDDVKLDLCCNTLIQVNNTANTTAICVGDIDILNVHENIIVQNGNISDFTQMGIRANDITNLDVHDINFTGGNRSQNAWLIDTCNNVTVKRCNVTGFLNINDAMILFVGCNCVSVNDVTVCGNTKARTTSAGSFNAATAFVGVNFCTNVEFDHVKVNNNTWNNQVRPGGNRLRRNLCIIVNNSQNCTLNNCETNNTVNLGGAPKGAQEISRALLLGFSDNITVTNHTSNNCFAQVPVQIYRGISTFVVNNLVFDGCQSNNNVMSSATIQDNLGESGVQGWFIGSSQAAPFLPNNGCVVRNCQANGNGFITTVTFLRPEDDVTAVGFDFDHDAPDGAIAIDHCQANNNFIGNGDGQVAGMAMGGRGVANITISNSSFDSNVGDASFGGEGIGLFLKPTNNLTISNCTANSNSAYGIASVTALFPLPERSNNLTIINCVCNDNGNLTFPSAGIAVGGDNILIKGCQVHRTFSGVEAAGIAISRYVIDVIDDIPVTVNSSNVVIEDTNVFDTTAVEGEAHGILLTECVDSKIINSQLHRNQNNGVELAGNNKNIVLCGNIALDNGDHGFNLGTFGQDINNNIYGVESVNCKSIRNGQDGFNVSGADLIFRSCISDLNNGSGYLFSPFTPFFARVATDTDVENLNIYGGNYSVDSLPNRLLFLPNDFLAETPATLPINGVAVEEGDIVLVKDQDDGTQDGVYVASQVQAPAGEELLLAAGAGPTAEEPYIDFTLPITMSGFDIIVITYNKDIYGLLGVDNCYFYPKNLVITDPLEEVEFPLETVPTPTGTIPTGDSIVTDGLKWTAISDGPWHVNVLTGEVGTQSSADPAGTRVITCGFRNEFADDFGTAYADLYGPAVAPVDLTNSVLVITLDDPTDGREYTFDLLARLSSQDVGFYGYGPDTLRISKNEFANPVWQLARVANWQEGENVRAGTKIVVAESNESNDNPGPVQYELNNNIVTGTNAASFTASQDITPGQSLIVVDNCRAANNDTHGIHNNANRVNVYKTVCELNGGIGFLDDSEGGAQANSNLYTRNKSYNNDGGNYSIDYVTLANPSVLQVGSINPPVFPTATAPEANVSLVQ